MGSTQPIAIETFSWLGYNIYWTEPSVWPVQVGPFQYQMLHPSTVMHRDMAYQTAYHSASWSKRFDAITCCRKATTFSAVFIYLTLAKKKNLATLVVWHKNICNDRQAHLIWGYQRTIHFINNVQRHFQSFRFFFTILLHYILARRWCVLIVFTYGGTVIKWIHARTERLLEFTNVSQHVFHFA